MRHATRIAWACVGIWTRRKKLNTSCHAKLPIVMFEIITEVAYISPHENDNVSVYAVH